MTVPSDLLNKHRCCTSRLQAWTQGFLCVPNVYHGRAAPVPNTKVLIWPCHALSEGINCQAALPRGEHFLSGLHVCLPFLSSMCRSTKSNKHIAVSLAGKSFDNSHSDTLPWKKAEAMNPSYKARSKSMARSSGWDLSTIKL